jgi:hypothetical protein
MSQFIQRRVLTGLLTSASLVFTLACSSNRTTETETWEVLIDYPIHHYFSGPAEQRIYQLSPDGKRLASLKTTGDFINLVVTDLSSGESRLATNFNDAMVTGYTWVNNDRLLFYTNDELSINAVDYDGGSLRAWTATTVVCKDECLADEEPVFLMTYTQVLDRLATKPKRVLVTSNHEDTLNPGLYELDTYTGKIFNVKPGPDSPQVYRWPSDGRGRVLQWFEQKSAISDLEFNTATETWSEVAFDSAMDESSREEQEVVSLLSGLQSELRLADIRIASIDDNRSKAVLVSTDGESVPVYFLYQFEDGSISPLAGTPMELSMLEENPSRIRVELIVVDNRYQHYTPYDKARPISDARTTTGRLSGWDTAARAAAYRSVGSRK